MSDVTGTVSDVAIRTTNVRTFDGLHVLIPNRHVYNEIITNWSYYPQRRVTMTVGVAYESDLARAYRVLSEAIAAAAGVLAEPASSVSFEGFDESSIRMVFRFWIEWQATDARVLQTELTRVITTAAPAPTTLPALSAWAGPANWLCPSASDGNPRQGVARPFGTRHL